MDGDAVERRVLALSVIKRPREELSVYICQGASKAIVVIGAPCRDRERGRDLMYLELGSCIARSNRYCNSRGLASDHRRVPWRT